MSHDVYRLLASIQRRPALYLGCLSVTRLRAFLDGYALALSDNALSFVKEHPPFQQFHDWVAMKLHQPTSTAGWQNMLLDATGDEAKALGLFFAYLEEFKQKQAAVILTVNLPLATTPKLWRIVMTNGVAYEQPPPPLIQIVKYTDDPGVFVNYVSDQQEILEEAYYEDLEEALWDGGTTLKVKKGDWRQPET